VRLCVDTHEAVLVLQADPQATQDGIVQPLTDSDDQVVRRTGLLRLGDRLVVARIEMAGIRASRLTGLHANETYAFRSEAGDLPPRANLDALSLGFQNLLGDRGHVLAILEADDHELLGPATQGAP